MILKKNTGLIALIFLWGCASQPESTGSSEGVAVDAMVASMDKPLPQNVANELLGVHTIEVEEDKPLPLPVFDIEAKAVPAKRFFVNLMKGANSNIVVHPDISGVITLNLKGVTIVDVLDVVRDVYGYEIKQTNSIFTVYSKKITTKVFPINYIDVERTGISDTSVLIGNTEQNDNAGGSAANDNNSSDSSSFGEASSPSSRVKTTSTTNFWATLQSTLSAIIGINAGVNTEVNTRRVVINSQAGVVIVSAMPSELSAVKQFLDRAQLSIKRQVIIEAKVIEVRLNEGYEAGVNWDQINGQLLLTKNVSEFDSSPSILSAQESVGEIFSSIVKVSSISDLLSLLKTQGEVQVLSSPRVSTINNQKAVIRVGSDEFFVTGVSSSTTSNASSTISTPNIELSSFFSGISLDVTPQIDSNSDVILHIHPVVSSVADQQKDITVGNESFSLPLALRHIRESDSIVKAKSGQIIVLGGLMQEKVSDVKGKRPVLGDIPLLKTLFNTRNKSRVKSELIILLQPVVVDDRLWHKNLSDSGERIKQFYPRQQ